MATKHNDGEFQAIQGWLNSVWAPLPQWRLEGDVESIESVAYNITMGHRPVRLDVFRKTNSQNRPCVVYIHGGAFLLGQKNGLPPTLQNPETFNRFLDAGITVVAIDYRLAGESIWPAQLHDASAAIAWIQHRAQGLGIDAANIFLWGESAGAHIAMHTGLRFNPNAEEYERLNGLAKIAGIINWYGPNDLVAQGSQPNSPEARLLGGQPQDLPEASWDANPCNFVTKDAPAIQIRHGNADKVVSVDQSRLLKAKLDEVGATYDYAEVPEADHCFFNFSPVLALVDEAVEFIKQNRNI